MPENLHSYRAVTERVADGEDTSSTSEGHVPPGDLYNISSYFIGYVISVHKFNTGTFSHYHNILQH
jgi:hypothetical protein